MYIVHNHEAVKCETSTACTAYEYCMSEKDINGAVVHIRGRYPNTGHAVNLRCKEMAYVISGSGRAVVDGKEVPLSKGDVILILPEEKFFWDGDMELFIPCTPAWTPEQYAYVP